MGKLYTANIPSHSQREHPILTGDQLRSLTYGFNSPFQIVLSGNQPFTAESVLRQVPGTRLVVKGEWENKPCVAKLFFDLKSAYNQLKREVAGHRILVSHQIKTPRLLYQGGAQDKTIYVILYEYIGDAEPFSVCYQKRRDLTQVMPMLEGMVLELATQHVVGVMQQDLHLNNFLVNDEYIYTLDGSDVILATGPFPQKESIEHLALFLAQLGTGIQEAQRALFAVYAKARNWLYTHQEELFLFQKIEQHQKKRFRQFKRKLFRSSTHFAKHKALHQRGMVVRSAMTPALSAMLSNLDCAFHHPSAIVLKAGRSATVIKVTVDDRDIVIKRYNMKDWRHFVRRALRATRARMNWLYGNAMQLFQLPTPKPIAYVEYHWFGLKHRSYYLSEFVPSESAEVVIERHHQKKSILQSLVKRIAQTIKGLAELKLTHQDLKITNLIVDRENHPYLIDLDSIQSHRTSLGLKRAWQSSVKRLLRNFSADSDILAQIKIELGWFE